MLSASSRPENCGIRPMDELDLRDEYDALKAEGERMAGGILDIPRRVIMLNRLYHHSGNNHVFPLLAAHGALWAFSYFEIGGALGQFIARRYFYDHRERAYRLGLLNQFAEAFRIVNRQVFIDTYANYRFTAVHGETPGADKIVPVRLLDVLNRVHFARSSGKVLGKSEKREVFDQAFLCEQEITVAPRIQSAIQEFNCRFMRFLCLHPIVRFAYFPGSKRLLFRNFASTEERIEKGLRAFAYAEQAGWSHVAETQRAYGLLSAGAFHKMKSDPDQLGDTVSSMETDVQTANSILHGVN